MPMTVGQYALDRGYSRTAIYKAIDRLGINETHTYKGINKEEFKIDYAKWDKICKKYISFFFNKIN